jgi:hypothetical protein
MARQQQQQQQHCPAQQHAAWLAHLGCRQSGAPANRKARQQEQQQQQQRQQQHHCSAQVPLFNTDMSPMLSDISMT